MENYNNYADSSDSDDEIKLEFNDSINGKSCTKIYTIPFRHSNTNKKKLICFSIINNENCVYGSNCTYAHSLSEQIIDEDKKYIYQIILDENLMNFFSVSDPKMEEIYKKLLCYTHICEQCTNNKCTGGYNCRNGVFDPCLKICKNDLMTGECLNKLIDVNVDNRIIDKVFHNDSVFKACDKYKGCINGHHLSLRKLVPYYKYIHQKENSRKYKYQSVRYIDIDPLGKIFKNNYSNLSTYYDINDNNDSESSTDEEINSWFSKKNNMDDADNSDCDDCDDN
ncbi:hypothetical protein QLL95_gp0984 [Cotonvirus japonicus]|uniref:C3H1-type domain-containing protein n=1 Tax=Cotonvirus japonicus TaxID=2811091 RepID=A0ABM7NSL6_9VIRU|nr:hypothetical protein QLL95_gp0984 [Cotonvirus japonicus]BCS83139.1 hypothetical protein [Cotonvirus japonicus]